MLTKRIIPCLDVKDGRVVKGVHFTDLKDAGDPVLSAKIYNEHMADELVFLDITATSDGRDIMTDMVRRTAESIYIPFTVGGGLRTLEDIRQMLNNGADKVSLNSRAVQNPSFITESSRKFGSQCIVLAIDAKKVAEEEWHVFIKGGREDTGLSAIQWAKEGERLGAGELLVTSMDRDGTKAGFDIELLRRITEVVNIPVIASGGAGKKEDFLEVFQKTNVDAALAASLFHYGELQIEDLKQYLKENGIEVRI